MTTVVLLSTRRLLPADFAAAREDLGGGPGLGLDVIGWVAPGAPVEENVDSFTLIGPGRMPAGRQDLAETPDQQPAGRLTKLLPRAIKRPVRFLRNNLAAKELGKNYWATLRRDAGAMNRIGEADVVVALDPGAIWAGWNIGQLRPDIPVVLGLPAARRELDQLKAPARHE